MITIISDQWSGEVRGGLNTYVDAVATELRRLGVQHRVVVHGQAKDMPPGYHSAGSAESNLMARLWRIWRILRSARMDSEVIVCHFPLYGLPVLALRRKPPIVIQFHGPWGAEHIAQGRWRHMGRIKEFLEFALFRQGTRFIVLSKTFSELLQSTYEVDERRISVISPGVNTQKYDLPRTASRRNLVLSVRRLVPRMGLDVLLKAWAEVEPREVQLTIVGDGPERSELEFLASSLSIRDRVRFLDKVDDAELTRLYSRSIVSVIPSRELEGFGLVALESLSCGVPVIASRVGGLAEFLPSLPGTRLVTPGSVLELAESIRSVLDEFEEVGTNREALRKGAENFSWERTTRALLSVYRPI